MAGGARDDPGRAEPPGEKSRGGERDSGTLDVERDLGTDDLEGGDIDARIDLVNTLESGQSFRWRRVGGSPPEYTTVVYGEGLRVRENSSGVSYETTGLPEAEVRRVLGLDDDLEEVHSAICHDERVARAVEEYGEMRLMHDEFFGCLVSFIVSANNRIPRIHRLVGELCEAYGPRVEGFGHGFPRPDVLADATEGELRDLGLGYRAPYVLESAEMVSSGEFEPALVREMEYERAHEEVQRLVGVGPKVGDCVLLFSLGFQEAVPLDTWMQRAMERHYPELVGPSYRETADGFRDRFGEHAGHAQNYLFHYVRTVEG